MKSEHQETTLFLILIYNICIELNMK